MKRKRDPVIHKLKTFSYFQEPEKYGMLVKTDSTSGREKEKLLQKKGKNLIMRSILI